MSAHHITVTCDKHINNIFSGFSRLQEHQEFVDLTLAADNHLVKVHKNIIALASPYLKEMLKAASSHNPVIFLNNVNHRILAYLLEYIYQGEVNVPLDHLDSFLQVSQSLHITGIKKLTLPKKVSLCSIPTTETQNFPLTECLDQIPPKLNSNEDTSIIQPEEQTPVIALNNENDRPNNFAACITINSDHNFEVQQFAENIQVVNTEHDYSTNIHDEDPADISKDLPFIIDCKINAEIPQTTEMENNFNTDIPQTNMANNFNTEIPQTTNVENTYNIKIPQTDIQYKLSLIQEQTPNTEDTSLQPTTSSDAIANSETPLLDLTKPINLDKESKEALKVLTQFSITERGAVQIIVSRYIYCSHHNSRGGRKHRWRCLNYRNLRCPAFIDSFDEKIILRSGIHNHTYHDNKIYKKHKDGRIFHSIAQVKEFRDMPQSSREAETDIEKVIDFNVIPVNMSKGES